MLRSSSTSPISVTALTTLVGLLCVAAAHAQPRTVVSDFETTSSMNNLGGFWYFYDDRSSGGESYITTADSAFQYQWDTTTFAPGRSGTDQSVEMGFVLGAKSPTCGINCTYPSQVGMGTTIYGGTGTDIRGATGISFWAKAQAPLKVVFTVGTLDIKDNGFYQTLVSVGTQWTKYTLPLTPGKDFAQPSWAVKKPFDPAQFTSLGWMIGKGDNTGLTQGSFFLDDVAVEGWVPPEDPAALVTPKAGVGGPRMSASGNSMRVALPAIWNGRQGMVYAVDARGQVLGRAAFGAQDKDAVVNLVRHAPGAPVWLHVTPK